MIPETILSSFFSLATALSLTPFISRLYGPEAYGQFSVALGAATLTATVAQFALVNAIAFEAALASRLRLTAALLKATAIAGVATVVILLLIGFTERGAQLVGSKNLIALGAAVSIATCLFRIASAWSTAQGLFRPQVAARIAGAIVARPLSIVLGLSFVPTASLMLIAEAGGLGAQLGALCRRAGRRTFRVLWRRYVPKSSFGRQIKEHYVFTAFDFPSQLLLMGATVVPPFVFGLRFGADWAGWTSLGLSLIGMPVQLVSLAVAPAMLFRVREATESMDRQAVVFLHRAFALLLVIGAVGYGLLAAIAHWLLPGYLGAQWRVTGEIVAWLCLPFALHFAAFPFHMLHRQVGRNHWRLGVDVLFSFAALTALTLKVVASDPMNVVRAWALALTLHRVADIGLLFLSRQRASQSR